MARTSVDPASVLMALFYSSLHFLLFLVALLLLLLLLRIRLFLTLLLCVLLFRPLLWLPRACVRGGRRCARARGVGARLAVEPRGWQRGGPAGGPGGVRATPRRSPLVTTKNYEEEEKKGTECPH